MLLVAILQGRIVEMEDVSQKRATGMAYGAQRELEGKQN